MYTYKFDDFNVNDVNSSDIIFWKAHWSAYTLNSYDSISHIINSVSQLFTI